MKTGGASGTERELRKVTVDNEEVKNQKENDKVMKTGDAWEIEKSRRKVIGSQEKKEHRSHSGKTNRNGRKGVVG